MRLSEELAEGRLTDDGDEWDLNELLNHLNSLDDDAYTGVLSVLTVIRRRVTLLEVEAHAS